ncbi:MAG: hypothetical protein HXX17_01450, partial [Geobacteraceae bacterium]|nr:hypothetical protein [Geobacteraceae bacterium]
MKKSAKTKSMSLQNRGRSVPIIMVLLIFLIFTSRPVHAVIDVVNNFNPIHVLPNQTSTLTIVLNNSNTVAATSVGLTDTLPTNVTATSVVSNGCGGTLSISNPSSIVLSGGTIPATVGVVTGTCQMQVLVKPSAAGTYVNTIAASSVSSSQGTNSQATSASLTVPAVQALTASKTYSGSPLHVNGVTTLTLTISNPNSSPVNNVSFTDDFTTPTAAHLIVAGTTYVDTTAPVTGGTCSGKVITNKTGGTLAVGDTAFKVTGITIPAYSSCTVTVNAKLNSSEANLSQVNVGYTNTIPAAGITSTEGAQNASAITGSIQVQSGSTVANSFSPATIYLGTTSTLSITFNNYNTTAISGVGITDTLPGTITTNSLVSNGCTGSSVNLTGGQIAISGVTIPAAASATGSSLGSCTIQVKVNATGTGTNTIAGGSFGGIAYNGSSATLTVQTSPITVSKSFLPTSVVQGNSSILTINLANVSGNNGTITSFTDLLTTMGSGYTIGSSATPMTSCCLANSCLTATPGSTSITLNGGTVPAGGSCQIIVPIAVAINAATGTRTNTIAANALVTTLGNNQAAATGSLTSNAAATFSKSFSPTTVRPNTVTRATITINRASGGMDLTNMGITDLLSTMGTGVNSFTIANPGNITNTCGGYLTNTSGGSIASGDSSLVLHGGALKAPATSCKIQFDILAPSTATAGNKINTIAVGAFTNDQGITNASTVVSNLTITTTAPDVTINKTFSPITANGGAPVTLRIDIYNTTTGAIALSNVSLTDSFPSGMEIYQTPGASTSNCGAPIISAVAGGSSVTLSGATVAAGATCSLTVNVTGTTDGNHNNTITTSSLSSAQGVTNNNAVTVTQNIVKDINIAKSFNPTQIES